MHFIIIRADGSPLTMHGGEPILFETESMARAWLCEGEQVAPAPAGTEGLRGMDDGPSNGDR